MRMDYDWLCHCDCPGRPAWSTLTATVSVSMPSGRRRTAAETSFPASGEVGVATEMLLTKAEHVSDEDGGAQPG